MADPKKATTPAATDADEFYDDATEEFPSIIDLVPKADRKGKHEGRLVAIWAKENGEAKGDNGPYGYTETITLVLDDGPNGDQVTDLVGPAPVRLDLRHSTTGLHTRLKPRVEGMSKPKLDADGNILRPAVPLKFRPMIGRINSQPNTKYRTGSPAISISLPTDADRAVIEKYRAKIVEINTELERKAKEAADAEAFDE